MNAKRETHCHHRSSTIVCRDVEGGGIAIQLRQAGSGVPKPDAVPVVRRA
jgi:hypothetical protein